MSIYISRDFKYSEFACPDCGKSRPINPRFIFLLQSLREKINRPIYISKGGGLRCIPYNKRIGGYRYSAHLTGQAVDIHAKNMDIITLAREAKDIGFSRIGIYVFANTPFIHIDILKPRPSKAWLRDGDGIYYYFTTLEDAIKCVGGS